MYSTWGILRQAVDILMQTTPVDIDIAQLKKDVEGIPGVENLHHLHVWKLDDEQILLEAHINTGQDLQLSRLAPLRRQIEKLLAERYGISHATLQMEYKGCKGDDALIHTQGV